MNNLAEISFKRLKRTYKESYQITERIFNLPDQRKDFIFGLEDKVLVGFFEEVLRATKSIITLLSNENPNSVTIIVRNIFEGRLYIQYLVDKKGDSNLRAKSYVLHYYRTQLNLAKTIIGKNNIGAEIRREFGINSNEWSFNEEKIDEELNKVKDNFSEVLKYRKFKDSWYNLDGKTDTIEKLAFKLNMRPHYEFFYRLYSQDAHSLNAIKAINVTDEIDELNRNLTYVNQHKEKLEDIYLSLVATDNYLVEITEIILKYYKMDKELRSYNKKINLRV